MGEFRGFTGYAASQADADVFCIHIADIPLPRIGHASCRRGQNRRPGFRVLVDFPLAYRRVVSVSLRAAAGTFETSREPPAGFDGASGSGKTRACAASAQHAGTDEERSARVGTCGARTAGLGCARRSCGRPQLARGTGDGAESAARAAGAGVQFAGQRAAGSADSSASAPSSGISAYRVNCQL